MSEQPYDASNPVHVEKKTTSAKARAQMIEDGFRQLVSTKNGRAWLWNHISQLGPFRTAFNKDPIQMAFNAGAQASALDLLAKLTKPEHIGTYKLMMEEHNER